MVSRHMVCVSVLALLAAAQTSCDDWNDPENLDVNVPAHSTEPGYTEYLALLREYRQSKHKIVYAEFENVESPRSRAEHPASLPDSIDYICLNHPEVMPQWLDKELKAVKADKGMQVIYAVDFQSLEAEYEELSAEEEHPIEQSFIEFAAPRLDEAFALCDKMGYDGLTMRYNGKSTLVMTEEERLEFMSRQQLMLDKTTAWLKDHSDKKFFFEGYTEFLMNKAFLKSADYIIIKTEEVTDCRQLTLRALISLKPNVPTDNLLVIVSAPSLDPADTSTGMYKDSSGKAVPALREAAYWVATDDAQFTKAGLVIKNTTNDYHNAEFTYKGVRQATAIMNPTPKTI